MHLLSFSGTAFLATVFLSAAAMPTSQPPKGVSLVLSLEVPSSVDNVDDFTITGTLKSESMKDIKVVTDPSGILFDYFAPDVFDFKKESVETTKEMTEEESDEKTKPVFVGGIAKWSIETYLTLYEEDGDEGVENKDAHAGTPEGGSAGFPDYTSDDEDTSSSQVSASDSSKTSEGSTQGEGRTYPPFTTHTLNAGDSMDFTYKVGKGYDFTKSGAGVYNVKLKRDFFWVLVDDVVTTVKVDITSSKVEIKGKLAGKFPPPKKIQSWTGINKREEPALGTIDCPAVAIPIILRTAKMAMKLVAASRKSLDDMDADGSDRGPYEHWFGDWDTKETIFQPYRPRDHVKAMYKGIRPFNTAGIDGGYTYDCDCDRNTVAYIVLGEFYEAPENPVIHLCNLFRSHLAPIAGGTDTKAGTLIHEATHFPFVRPRTQDFAYGTIDAHALRSSPFMAARNADSYEFFSEELYEPSMDEPIQKVKPVV